MNLNKKEQILAIDASRCRSGGAVNHIVNILKHVDYANLKFKEIHIWSYNELLQKIPNSKYLIKHKSYLLNLSLPFQLFWQAFLLKYNLKKYKCTLLFTADSSTLCYFKKHVILNQDLLSFEKELYSKMPISFEKIRIIILRYVQNRAFKNAKGLIFLSNYTKDKILDQCDIKINSIVVPHGVDSDFSCIKSNDWDFSSTQQIKCLYVSPIFEYKNQLNVIKAVNLLREKGYNISINLIGGGKGYYYDNLLDYISNLANSNDWIVLENFLSKDDLILRLKDSHIFIFASSCETFGITLLEGMSAEMPIICSNRSSLPEILSSGGLYFNPDDIFEISRSLEEVILNKKLRIDISQKAKIISTNYTWKICSKETFNFIESHI
jgi:glycosyltransferase involved in cell wall biosynthesis